MIIKINNEKLEIDIKNITKFWEREYSFFILSSWKLSFNIINKREYGNGAIKTFLCVYKNGVVTNYRNSDEEKYFEKYIGEKIVNNISLRNKIVKLYILHAEHLLKLFKIIDKTNEISYRLIKNFYLTTGDFFAYNFFIQRGIDYIGSIENVKNIKTLIKLRTKYAKIVIGQYEDYIEKICKKVANKKNILNFSLLKFLTGEELIEFIKTKKLPNNFDKRKQITVIILLPRLLLLSGKKAYNIVKLLEKRIEKKENYKDILKGISVFNKGVKGKVKVIKNIRELNKLKIDSDLEILVVPSTLPKYDNILIKA
ncbi:MAG: hypothetical protein GWO87_02120, partial [Xanthomonadaceae bacterium]|nr:hypothetical protein [Rhodospirillaceae bacterium]NIA17964.1 hypothetical protein [Xanthomonadaceae bacterium]